MIKISAAMPEIMSACGIGMLGYGLYLFKPWVSFSVCGTLIMLGGLLLGISANRKKAK